MSNYHEPVMLKEVLENLNPKAGQIFVDATLGGGGYTEALAQSVGKEGKVLAIDADEMAIENAKKLIKEKKINNIALVHDNFRNLQNILVKNKLDVIDGIVADLGLSSAQLQDRSRGFSFGLDAPLVMSFDSADQETTLDIVNKYSKEKLEQIIREYGEERYAGRISGAIVQARRSPETMHSGRRIAPAIRSAKQLAQIIFNAVPAAYRHGRVHPATRTFQALRIATNDELTSLQELLSQSVSVLKKGGRIAVVSFHSLEDRIVKNFFRTQAKDCVCPSEIPICQCGHQRSLKIINKKVITPSIGEIKNNARSRSAKLRVAQRI
ncbi:MAG: 16S rRNA (cytosine(1402)-N(4))-methyltransferase RsmH [bacterium]|nr:16S rRNA (cytosine(1402)-N(4))-methyltransferase RsmH [bacterium]